jgi:3-deoxy-D-manno-octulosonate 8-phosphate phosphatase KdsC-like HAD superfamily phosphatase
MAARRKAVRLTAALAQRLRLLVLDCDGVLTDGALYFGAAGEQLKVFHVRDGHGIKQVQAAGIEVAVISGRRSPALARRCREFGHPPCAPGRGRQIRHARCAAAQTQTQRRADRLCR